VGDFARGPIRGGGGFRHSIGSRGREGKWMIPVCRKKKRGSACHKRFSGSTKEEPQNELLGEVGPV